MRAAAPFASSSHSSVSSEKLPHTVWHSASVNLTPDQARLVVETNFAAHKVAGGAYGGGNTYRHLPLNAAIEKEISDDQLRVLGRRRARR